MQEICASGFYEKGSMCKQRYGLIAVCLCIDNSHTHDVDTSVVDAGSWAKLLSRVQCMLQMKTTMSVLSLVYELFISLIFLLVFI